VVQGQTGRKDAAEELRSRITGGKAPGNVVEPPADPMAELEAAINKIDSMEAKDLLRAHARMVRAKMELQAKEMERQAAAPGPETKPRTDAESEVTKDKIAATAITLLEKGVPSNVVGEYLKSGLSQGIPVALGGINGGQQGLQLSDIKTIMEMMKGEKGSDPELKQLLLKMDERLARVEGERRPVEREPQTWVVVNPDGSVQRLQSNEPIVIKPPVPAASGESVEMVKEKNRHDEELQKIENDKAYKNQIASTLAELPERIGSGLAGRMMEQEGGGAPAEKSTSTRMEYLACTGEVEGKPCGFNIPIPPNAGTQIECPRCHTIYGRDKK
jgi:hypothetical protein